MGEEPTTAFKLSLIGGILVLLGGLIWAWIGAGIAIEYGLIIFVYGPGVLLWAPLMFGIIIILGSVRMYSAPDSVRVGWGIVIVILGAFSIFGFTTTLGGILRARAIVWKPSSEEPY